MQNKTELFNKIQSLATECHQLACSLELGTERIEMFEVYGVLNNITRRGYASSVSKAMNPLLSFPEDDDEWDEDDD